MGGLFGTGLALVFLQVVVSAAQQSGGAASLLSLFDVPARIAASWMDPRQPLIPARAHATAATTAAPATTAPATIQSAV